MFGKLRIFDYWIFLLLVICISQLYLSKSVEESSADGSKTVDEITVGDATGKLLHTLSQRRKCSNTLRAAIARSYKNRWKHENAVSRKITRRVLSVPNLPLMKDEVNIEATSIYNEVESTRMADSSCTESSFPSSHPSTIISKKLEDGESPEADLNDTSAETFQADNETGFSNASEELQQQNADLQVHGFGTQSTLEPSQEDIPSFREWTEKHLAEKEKERASIGDDNVTNVPSNGHKVRKKNFASLDCGAKLVASNPEAKSTGSLLSTSRDEYLLSVCNTKIWFVVELCEAVQLKRIELANFELFSSSPKEFSVSIADRFPSRDWTVVGQFTAKDEKSVQSFDLQQNHFTKYIKMEFHSHYGKEHFCPISLFRVYGTSELEVLETVDDEEMQTDTIESDFDANEPIMSEIDSRKRKLEANNLFGSAKEAVMNIVKKAAQVLIPSSNNSTSNSTLLSNATTCEGQMALEANQQCITPRYVIICQDCGENFFNQLFSLISCYSKELDQLLQMDSIWKPLIKSSVCFTFGITSSYLPRQLTTSFANENFHHNDMYSMYLLPREIIAALCNLVAISENRLKPNVTLDKTLPLNQTSKRYSVMNVELKESTYDTSYPINEDITTSSLHSKPETSTFKIIEHTSGMMPPPESQFVGSHIKPTKTTAPVDDEDAKIKAQLQPSVVDDVPQVIAPAASSIPTHVPIVPNVVSNEQIKSIPEEPEVGKESDHLNETMEDSMSLDSLISELEKTEVTSSVHPATPKPTMQKESVFVRLANRIKALERNMSLSGQYLDELSRRYKKQVEDMQRMLSEVTVRETKRSQEVSQLTARISELTRSVDGLIGERDSWSDKALRVGEHSLILFLEIVIFICIVCLCRGIPRVEISKRKFSLEWRHGQADQIAAEKALITVTRRQSLDDLSTQRSKPQHKRRPSEEAMKVDCHAHQDLLIRSSKVESRRRKRRRKELLLKSNANAINLETGDVRTLRAKKLAAVQKTNAPLSRSASASEIDEHSWGRYAYAGMIDRGDRGEQGIELKENVALLEENEFPAIFPTATSVRTKRISVNQFNGKNVLSPVYDVSSDQDSSVPSTPIKEKRLNIKKIMRKFF